MKAIFIFLKENLITFLGMIAGMVAGYFYWYHYGIYDGTFGFSSEMWVSCVYGLLLGGFVGSLVKNHTAHET